MKRSNYLACALLVAASAAHAQMSPNMSTPTPAQAPAMTEGVVQAVDASMGV